MTTLREILNELPSASVDFAVLSFFIGAGYVLLKLVA
jgi:hypothetical protein